MQAMLSLIPDFLSPYLKAMASWVGSLNPTEYAILAVVTSIILSVLENKRRDRQDQQDEEQ